MSEEENQNGGAGGAGADSGGSQSGQRPGGSDSASPADDSGGQRQAAGKPSRRPVPYERVQELTRANRELKRQLAALNAQMQQGLQQQGGGQQQAAQSQFDPETDRAIGDLADNRVKQALTPMQQEFQRLKLRVLLSDIRAENPDFDEFQEDFFDTFNELMAEGFGDKKTAAVILKAIRADRGVYRQEGKKEAKTQERIEAGMAGPGGGGGTRDRSDASAAFPRGKTREEREKFRQKVKAGMVR